MKFSESYTPAPKEIKKTEGFMLEEESESGEKASELQCANKETAKEKEKNPEVVKESDKNLEMEKFAETLSMHLNSESTLKMLKEMSEGREKIKKNNAIALIIKYFILHPDGYKFEEILESLGDSVYDSRSQYLVDYEAEFLIKTVADRLGIEDIETSDSKDKIVQYFIHHYGDNGFWFHSFNSVFEQSIRKNGLSPEIRQWDWKEIDEINNIFKKHGFGHSFMGWSNSNSKGQISVANCYEFLYDYALSSPEWFNQFVAGVHIPNNEPYDKTAFFRKDYLAARINMELFLEKTKDEYGESLPVIDKNKILAFFEKYWYLLANDESRPMVALVKNKVAPAPSGPFNNFNFRSYAEYEERRNYEFTSVKECVGYILKGFHHDYQIEDGISPSDIAIISLPSYNEIHKEKDLGFESKIERLKLEAKARGLVMEVQIEKEKQGSEKDIKRFQDEVLSVARQLFNLEFPYEKDGDPVSVEGFIRGAYNSWVILKTPTASPGDKYYVFRNGKLA